MSELYSPQQIRAMIRLLDDEDDGVKDHVRTALRTAGPVATPFLQAASAIHVEETIREESESVLEDIRVDEIERGWIDLQTAPDGHALEEGALLLERLFDDGGARGAAWARSELDTLAARARKALPAADAELTARVRGLQSFIHDTCGFRGNTDRYYDPENSFLTRVLEHRTGIPITLALVYLSIAHRIGLPLVGVSMPMHFLVGYEARGAYRYVDPFFGGREVSRGECLPLLERAGFEPAEAYLRPAPVVSILERMARNLIIIFQHTAHERELRLARRFVTLLTGQETL